MISISKHLCILLLTLCFLLGCSSQKQLKTKTKHNNAISIGRTTQHLPEKSESPQHLHSTLRSFDTFYYFTRVLEIPAQLIYTLDNTNSTITDTLRFVLAKKENDLYFWGDQNFNGTISDDGLVIRKNFFQDTAHRWLRQFDRKIDYSFHIKHLSDRKKNISVDMGIDISKVALKDKGSYALDVLYQSKPAYKRAFIRSGLKRYIAIVDHLPVARIYGYGQDAVYISSKKDLKEKLIVNPYKKYFEGDTIKLGKREWILDHLTYRGDRITLIKTSSAKNRFGIKEGEYIASFEAKELYSDSAILFTNLKKKEKTLLLFWGSWCIPCKNNVPVYNNLYNSMDKGSTNFIGVIWDKSQRLDSIRKDIKDLEVQWPNVLSEMGSEEKTQLANQFRVESISTYIIFDEAGKIIYKGNDFDQIKKILLVNK